MTDTGLPLAAECLHVKVFNELVNRRRLQVPLISPVTQSEFLDYGRGEPIMLLETSSVKVFSFSSSHRAFSRTIFCVEKGQLKCKRKGCKREWTNCQHVGEFESWVEDQDESTRIKFLGVPDEPPPSRSSRDKNSDAVPRIKLPLHFMAPQTALRISPEHPGHWIPPCAV